MRRLMSLLLPALIPSWRFFKSVGPSPRIEMRQRDGWADMMPAPARLGPEQLALRLVWNPRWNAHLYRVTCAEKLVATGSPPALAHLQRITGGDFRVAFVYRDGAQIRRLVAFPEDRDDA